MKFSGFGQILDLINFANQTMYTGSQVALKSYQTKAEADVARNQQNLNAQIEAMDISQQEKQLLRNTLIAQQQNETIKNIALYGGIGFAAVAIILVVGILFVKSAQKEKYEYVMEKIK